MRDLPVLKAAPAIEARFLVQGEFGEWKTGRLEQFYLLLPAA
jgi:hypothetical protein